MNHFRKPLYASINPPGTYEEKLPHPSGRTETVPVALVQEHRFVFFYWLSWALEKDGPRRAAPPDLVTFDWHKDLAPPGDKEIRDLELLDPTHPAEAVLFTWGHLNPYNDGHILAAAYLGLIGDIHVVCKQKFAIARDFPDRHGHTHRVFVYETASGLSRLPEQLQGERCYLDFDLDYFTDTSYPFGGGDDLHIMKDEEIRRLLNPRSALFSLLFRRLAGMTIATEPRFCGGIGNQGHLLSLLDRQLFYPSLLSPAANWRHLAPPGRGKTPEGI